MMARLRDGEMARVHDSMKGANEGADVRVDEGMTAPPARPTTAPTRTRGPLIPPHVAWPAFVIFLLLISVGVSAAALWAANSDGGAVLVREPTEQNDP